MNKKTWFITGLILVAVFMFIYMITHLESPQIKQDSPYTDEPVQYPVDPNYDPKG